MKQLNFERSFAEILISFSALPFITVQLGSKSLPTVSFTVKTVISPLVISSVTIPVSRHSVLIHSPYLCSANKLSGIEAMEAIISIGFSELSLKNQYRKTSDSIREKELP